MNSRLIAIPGGDNPICGVHVAVKVKSILSMQKVQEPNKVIPNSLYTTIHGRYELYHSNSRVSPGHAAIKGSSRSVIIRN